MSAAWKRLNYKGIRVPSGTSSQSLSAVVITRDAAGQLGPCLASLAFAQEILVVDSGSTDGTVELAQAHGAHVIEHAWLGYGRQKQLAVAKAAHDWVLCLDADERVSDELRASIVAELAAPRGFVYAMPRCNQFLGRWLRHGEGYPDWNTRLFHRAHASWSDDPVHEHVLTTHPVIRLIGDLMHESAETLERYLDKQNRYTTLQAEKMLAEGRTAGGFALLFSPLARFFKFYVVRLGFLDGLAGLVHISIGCMNSFMKYAKLIALRKAAR
jgi:glycosyltransferase involved in cell wall biosynthesis